MGYLVPWGQAVAWEQWMMGYSTTLQVPLAAGGGDGFGGPGFPFRGGKLVNNQQQYYLSRAVPYQCPALSPEHLFVSPVATKEEDATSVTDRTIFAHDCFGNT